MISATNTDLQAACTSGQFREDLLFRLNTVEIHVPPLRERREDIPALAIHFLRRYASRYRREIGGFGKHEISNDLDQDQHRSRCRDHGRYIEHRFGN